MLYATDFGGSLYQYNLELATPADIINSKLEIMNNIAGLGALQIAPNGKIYIAREFFSYLSVINDPNVLGTGCNYQDIGISLISGRSKLGLPPFIQSYFWKEVTSENLCYGENTQFSIVNPEVSQVWNFDDPASGTNDTSTLPNPIHTFTAPGTYAVEVESTNFLDRKSVV